MYCEEQKTWSLLYKNDLHLRNGKLLVELTQKIRFCGCQTDISITRKYLLFWQGRWKKWISASSCLRIFITFWCKKLLIGMTSFLKPPLKDSGELKTDSAHEYKKGKQQQKRDWIQGTETTKISDLEQMEAFTPAEGVTAGRDNPGTRKVPLKKQTDGSLC